MPRSTLCNLSYVKDSTLKHYGPSEKAWAKAAVQNIGRPFAGPLILHIGSMRSVSL